MVHKKYQKKKTRQEVNDKIVYYYKKIHELYNQQILFTVIKHRQKNVCLAQATSLTEKFVRDCKKLFKIKAKKEIDEKLAQQI